MSSEFVERLHAIIKPERDSLFQTRLIRGLLHDARLPLAVWITYLRESYHYVKHNGVNQAAAVLRTDLQLKPLMLRYLKHACEELDHEEMCLHDLSTLGVSRDSVIQSRPLPETAAFTSLLYDFVQRENPIGRLGYSFWAEGSNEYADLMIGRLRYHFGLQDEQMTFVLDHARLDRGHARACERTIAQFATSPSDHEAISYFAVATCRQFRHVLEAMYDDAMQGHENVVAIQRSVSRVG